MLHTKYKTMVLGLVDFDKKIFKISLYNSI